MEDYADVERLDLNRHLIRNPATTYFVRATSEITPCGRGGVAVRPGDLLVVDQTGECADGDLVIVESGDELSCRRYQASAQAQEGQLFGKVLHIIHTLGGATTTAAAKAADEWPEEIDA